MSIEIVVQTQHVLCSLFIEGVRVVSLLKIYPRVARRQFPVLWHDEVSRLSVISPVIAAFRAAPIVVTEIARRLHGQPLPAKASVQGRVRRAVPRQHVLKS